MSESLSASRLGQSFLEFLNVRHGEELQCRGVRRFDIRDKHAPNGYHELFADVGNALDDVLGLPESGDGPHTADIPKCMYKRNLCGLHRRTCLGFLGERGSEASQYHPTKPGSPLMEPNLTMDALSDYDGHEELRSSCGSTDEPVHNINGEIVPGLDNGLDDDLSDESDDENELPSSVDACDMAEYDKEEVIRKDQVSHRRRQRMKIDQDDVRTLVSVFDDDDRPQSTADPMKSESTKQASRMTPKVTGGRSSSSPSTPKNDASCLQRSYDIHSARTSSYHAHYRESPGYRTFRTVTTLSADPSYDEDVEANEEAVRKQIQDPFTQKGFISAFGEAGFVYAFRDNELPLMKIGHTAGKLTTRKSNIERSWGYIKSMSLVAAVKVQAYKRLEKIIHQDLAPHRRFFDCACGDKKKNRFTRHEEYFEIDDNTAVNTLQLWADFVKRQPWEQNSWSQKGTHLKSNWHDKLLTPSRIEPSETHDSHVDRIKRWRKFLDIPLPEVDIEVPTPGTGTTNRPSISPLTTRSTTQKHSAVTGPTAISSPDCTPSKPSRTTIEDMAETGKPVKTERSLSESLKHASCSAEPFNPTNEQDTRSTAHETTFDIPYRPFTFRKGTPIFNGPAAYTASNPQIKNASNEHSVSVADTLSHPIFNSMDSQQSGVVSPVGSDLRKTDRLHNQNRPGDAISLPSQEIPKSAATVGVSPLLQTMAELATCLLAKEVRPLPARAISADIWQFRWPLACSIAFALHSPHIPAGLSFLMWSIFLPFFVAELRGWTVVGQV